MREIQAPRLVQKTMKDGEAALSGLLTKTKEVITHSNQYLSITRTIQSVFATILSRLSVNENHVEDSAMANIKTITVTYHIDEDTGKVVNATRHDGRPGDYKAPQGAVTDCQAFVVTHNSPSCIYIQISGVWYAFCT
jgi:hypothetical protein